MRVKISDKDKGYAKMLKALTGKSPTLKVGVFGEEASKEHEGVSNGELATIHEFGLGVPERSFIRSWVDENQDKAASFLRQQIEVQLKNGSEDFRQAIERLGLFCVAGIQARMSEGIPPPLAASTIKAKGSSTPLINTGQLRSSVTYALVD